MSRSLTVDDLLEGLRQEGQTESSGFFTLDIGQAAQKISAFQLSNPYFYCLKWLQAGARGGASQFWWRSDRRKIQVSLDGLVLNFDRLPRLPSLLFEPGASPAERHLSAGLNSVIRTKASQVTVLCSDGKRATQAVWKPGKLELTNLPEDQIGPAATQIVVQRTAGDALREFWYAANHHHVGTPAGYRHARDREQTILHQRSFFAPLQVVIHGFPPDGTLVYREPADFLSFFASFLGAPPSTPELPFRKEHWVKAEPEQGFMPLSDRKSPRDWRQEVFERCRIYIGWPHKPHRHSILYPVIDGVLADPIEIFKGQPGCVFVCSCEQLDTDLSGLSLVQNEKWSALLNELRAHLSA